MNVSLTPEIEAFVRRKVQEGRYNNASELVRDALRRLENEEREYEAKLAWLRSEIAKGVADLEAGRVVSLDELDARLDAIDRERGVA